MIRYDLPSKPSFTGQATTKKGKIKMTLRQIYKRAKRINPFYQKSTFADFIQDFKNCTEDFFLTIREFKKHAKDEKLWISWNKFYKKYY